MARSTQALRLAISFLRMLRGDLIAEARLLVVIGWLRASVRLGSPYPNTAVNLFSPWSLFSPRETPLEDPGFHRHDDERQWCDLMSRRRSRNWSAVEKRLKRASPLKPARQRRRDPALNAFQFPFSATRFFRSLQISPHTCCWALVTSATGTLDLRLSPLMPPQRQFSTS